MQGGQRTVSSRYMKLDFFRSPYTPSNFVIEMHRANGRARLYGTSNWCRLIARWRCLMLRCLITSRRRCCFVLLPAVESFGLGADHGAVSAARR
jgi:hypothetical protein